MFAANNVNSNNCSSPPRSTTQPIQPVTALPTYQDAKLLPTVFIITPTYKRPTQKVDLTKMCQTLMLVKQVKWIIIEDSENKTGLVTRLLANCAVDSVHLSYNTIKNEKGHRGVDQRNTGLQWILDHVASDTTDGAIYMGDDDNSYDIRLFEEVGNHITVSQKYNVCVHAPRRSFLLSNLVPLQIRVQIEGGTRGTEEKKGRGWKREEWMAKKRGREGKQRREREEGARKERKEQGKRWN